MKRYTIRGLHNQGIGFGREAIRGLITSVNRKINQLIGALIHCIHLYVCICSKKIHRYYTYKVLGSTVIEAGAAWAEVSSQGEINSWVSRLQIWQWEALKPKKCSFISSSSSIYQKRKNKRNLPFSVEGHSKIRYLVK